MTEGQEAPLTTESAGNGAPDHVIPRHFFPDLVQHTNHEVITHLLDDPHRLRIIAPILPRLLTNLQGPLGIEIDERCLRSVIAQTRDLLTRGIQLDI